MDKVNRVDWAKTRELGKIKYILVYWILSASIPVAIALSALRGLFKQYNVKDFLTTKFVSNLILYIILSSAISLILGIKKWNKNERYFKS